MINVILMQRVEKLGQMGDTVTVKPGYARNFLLPRGLAYEATAGNLKRIAAERQRLEAAEGTRRDAAKELAKRIEEVLGRRLDRKVVDYPDSYPGDEPNRRSPDITKAETHLAYHPRVDLEMGLRRFLAWADRTYQGIEATVPGPKAAGVRALPSQKQPTVERRAAQ